MKSEFLIAVTQLAAERNLPREMVISAIEAALVSVYKRDTGSAGQNITVRLNPTTGEVSLFQVKQVVEEVADEARELTVKEAKQAAVKWALPNTNPKVGDELEFEMPTQVTGRIAAQTAKQVVIQRLREAERELVYNEFSDREGEIFTATIQRSDARYGGSVTLDLNGRAEATLPPSEQSPFERYRTNQKMKVLVLEVQRTNRGPEIIVSRTHPDLLRRLFEMEVPEVYNGIVEVRGIAREPGSRSKVAVIAKQEGVDPVGACIGLRGIRIQNIVNELQGEKIDVIQWSKDPTVFISHSLSPAQPLRVELDQSTVAATVVVSDRSLSLAIGREGQNARLAAKLTGWKVDIKSSTQLEIERMKEAIEGQVAAQEAAERTDAVETLPEPAVVFAGEEEPVPATGEVDESDSLVSVPEPVQAQVSIDEEELAALQAEIEAEEAEAAAGKLSAEEELALELLRDQQPQESMEVEEVVVEELVASDDEEIWKVPETLEQPQIRFAEDILGAPIGGRTGGGRRRRGGGRRNTPYRVQGGAARRAPNPPVQRDTPEPEEQQA